MTMTLDEAIAHSLKNARTEKCKKCADEHRQLAKWLMELKLWRRRSRDEDESEVPYTAVWRDR
jgi:hypothetical protein